MHINDNNLKPYIEIINSNLWCMFVCFITCTNSYYILHCFIKINKYIYIYIYSRSLVHKPTIKMLNPQLAFVLKFCLITIHFR